MPEWTKQQKYAIDVRNKNILVSAAAGSGKTAVLVERVIKLITDKNNPIDADKLLIVTFTNAAAAEMKSRISKSLNMLIRNNPEEELYRRQLMLLSCADICTIDSFCLKLVKEYFYELNINQDISIIDESELSVLQDNVIRETIDELFEEDGRSFNDLLDAYTLPGNDKPLIDMVKRLLSFIYSQPFPFMWLKNAIESLNPKIPFMKTIWYNYIVDEVGFLLDQAVLLANKNEEIAETYFEEQPSFKEVFESDLYIINSFINALENDWDKLLELSQSINNKTVKFKTLPRTTKLEESDAAQVKANRDLYKKIVSKYIQPFLVSSEEEYMQDMEKVYSQLNTLYKLIYEVDCKLMELKNERNAYSFSDIESLAIKLLFSVDDNGNILKSKIAESLSEKYSEILVDEYQDTNEAQDLLFSYLSNGSNLFTVGDLKQSIYRFRLAVPDIFNSKRKAYREYNEDLKDTNAKIVFDKNFRSKKGICDYVNFIFKNIMSDKVGEIDYTNEEYLTCGANYILNSTKCANITIINGFKGEEAEINEARQISSIIKDKINSKELIQENGKLRPVKYGDIVILMRSLKKYAGNMAEVLRSNGIPVVCDNSTNLFENSEIKMLLSLIRAVNNPTDSISLLAVMMSPFYSFTADELAQIKLESDNYGFYKAVFSSENEKVKSFINDLSDLKKVSVSLSVSSFIRYIIEDKDYIACINALGNGEQRYQNIVEFINFAKKFDNGIYVGLTAFIRFIDRIIESNRQVESAALSAGNSDAVTIMSIHHSKGLEFPICILAGSSRKYNKSDLSDNLLLNNKLGIAVRNYNEAGMYSYKNIPYSVISNKNDYEIMSENLRVLYVAMTRAKEQFITVASIPNIETRLKTLSKNIIDGKINPLSVSKFNNDADIFLTCSMLHSDGADLRKLAGQNYKCKENDFELKIDIINEVDNSSDEVKVEAAVYDNAVCNEIKEKLSFKYERKDLESLLPKLTASSLDDIDSGFDYIASSKPAFLSSAGLTPAQRGSALHAFMEYCDYKNLKSNIDNEIDRCRDLGFITHEQAEAIDRNMLKGFVNNNIFSRLLNADRIYKEIKVSRFYKASEIYDTVFDDKVLVQGIADLVFEENGKLILIDYKTDRVKNEDELLERYKKQIMFYKIAVSELLNKEIKETMLYSFYLNKCCYYK